MPIAFNKPYLNGQEITHIKEVFRTGHLSGNGNFTRRVLEFFTSKYGFQKVLLTNTCTHALELAGLLCEIQPGDEIIMPSFTFVSTANAFLLRGAKIVFADSNSYNPNLDCDLVESLITEKTRAIIPVHYAGIACDMDRIMQLSEKYGFFVIEDAAQAIDSTYKDQILGNIGHLGAISFHDTKNITAGEAGMLFINDTRFNLRSELIWEKGTNRGEFLKGKISKYDWVDIGSTFYPSEITAAILLAQLEDIEKVQQKRKKLWNIYFERLSGIEADGKIRLPSIPGYASNNAHMFYIILPDIQTRHKVMSGLKDKGIQSVFHFQSLHRSPYFKDRHDGRDLPMSNLYSDCLLRLPLYFSLNEEEVEWICSELINILNKK